MRSIITYYLLTIFGVFIIRPALPIIDYFINFDYIAEVLCLKKQVPESSCNGKCYLMQQMEENKHNDPQKNFPQTQWEFQLLSIHHPISYDLFYEEVNIKLVFSTLVISLKTHQFSIETPPPKQKSSSILA
jgi:hypothetical protein